MAVQSAASKIPAMHSSWWERLADEFAQPYMAELRQFLAQELKTNTLYPPMAEVFTAFQLTPFQDIKAVILGQDPYHGKGQAHGLCFSVKAGVTPPPSLKNIFKELNTDLGLHLSAVNGELTAWGRQGIFLLNTVLTVRAGAAASHRKRGWERFTDKVITLLNQERTGLVFLLWGRFAHEKAKLLDASKHKILKAAHPSPLSAEQGFWGCRHFSQTNAYLRRQEVAELDWRL